MKGYLNVTQGSMDHSGLLREFDSHISQYAAFAEKLRTLVSELLSASSLNVHSVTARPKDRVSFIAKLGKAEGRYNRIAEITDLAGVRIITYFADDVDRAAEVVRREFAVDAANSLDRRDLLDPERFGYLSLHYVVTLPPGRLAFPEYKRYTGLKAEIQIRSILQHAWAEIEHDLGYKTALGVPRDVRRQFLRLAGLLEIGDKEFASIRDALKNYESNLPSQIERNPEAVLLDKASLMAFIMGNEYFKNLEQKVANFTVGFTSKMPEVSFETFLAGLHFHGLRSIAELELALRKRETRILSFAGDWLRGGKGAIAQGATLAYLNYVLLGEVGDMDRTIEYLSKCNLGVALERPALAKRILENI